MGNLTAGTLTGSTFQTAPTGVLTKRVILRASNNDLIAYNDSNQVIAQVGGIGGGVYAENFSIDPAMVAVGNTSVPALFANNQSTGAPNDLAVGAQGSSLRGPALLGQATNAGGANHGLRAQNFGVGGTPTSGLVGVANGYDFYAEGAGINYGPFTGAHDVLVPNGQTIDVGYICVDVECIIRKNISNTVFKVTQSTLPNQVAIGVFVLNNGSLADFKPAAFIESYEMVEIDGRQVMQPIYYPEYDAIKNDYQYCGVNAVGEGQVYVCGENGNIQAGDLIVTSSVAGVGMKQADDIVRNITVAKAREAITFSDTTTPKLIACIYLCG